MTPRVLVITMYCGEGDFEASTRSIVAQQDVNVEHHVIHNKPELEAHRCLVQTWLDLQHRFDVMVKVDADSIVTNVSAFRRVIDTMSKHFASSAQLRLHDYYTDSMISGLNFFTKESKFHLPDDNVYCDRCVTHKLLIHSDNGMFDSDLVPIGKHCWYGTTRQAFHFGLHRGIKKRWNEMELVRAAMERHCDSRNSMRAFVMEGFKASVGFASRGFNYDDEQFNSAYFDAKERLNELV